MNQNQLLHRRHLAVALAALAVLAGCEAVQRVAPSVVGTAASYIPGASRVPVGTITMIAIRVIQHYQATKKQREVATARAQTFTRKVETKRKPKPKTRYVAVETPRVEKSKGQASVMIFDTETQQLVGNNQVYDIEKKPSKGEVAKFDTYTAQYVGTGA